MVEVKPVAAALTASKVAALSVVRRREPRVLWTPEGIGVGNFAYFWLQAYVRIQCGEPCRVRLTPAMAVWREWFPRVFSELVIADSDISFFNPRDRISYFQSYGSEFTASQLGSFIDRFLLSPAPFAQLVDKYRTEGVTINVRRGDYYSVPLYRGRYSFDVVEYLRAAIERASESAPVNSIRVVSDDPDWCRAKLGWLADVAPLTMPQAGTPVADQLAMLAGSRRLILTNSTFSYWGGYLATQVPDGAAGDQVFAPWFHSRQSHGGAAYQLDPRWSVIDSIPGGWDG